MRKLFLIIVLWLGVSYLFPDARRLFSDVARPLWAPVVKWDTREEMKQVGRDVINHEVTSGRLPDRRNWVDWLDWRYPMDELKLDHWGSMYHLKVWADSVAIISFGPDRIRNTEDDIQVSTPRERRRRRR